MTRGAAPVAGGKPVTMFVQGDYGIGKSSIATYVQSLAENNLSSPSENEAPLFGNDGEA